MFTASRTMTSARPIRTTASTLDGGGPMDRGNVVMSWWWRNVVLTKKKTWGQGRNTLRPKTSGDLAETGEGEGGREAGDDALECAVESGDDVLGPGLSRQPRRPHARRPRG